MTDKLPDNGGYVAAAYLVFLALILIYVAIMAGKLARIERQAAELNELAARQAGRRDGDATHGEPGSREGDATHGASRKPADEPLPAAERVESP
jgi:hypothetical protein